MTLVSDGLINDAFLLLIGAFVLTAIVAMYRVVQGPTTHDRVIGVNAIGTTTVLVIALLAAVLDEPSYLDVAIVYALLNFIMSVAISKFTVERGGVL